MPSTKTKDPSLARVTSRITTLVNQAGGVAEVANTLGVSRQTVYNWTGGEYHPDLASLIRISKVLHVDVNWLLGLR